MDACVRASQPVHRPVPTQLARSNSLRNPPPAASEHDCSHEILQIMCGGCRLHPHLRQLFLLGARVAVDLGANTISTIFGVFQAIQTLLFEYSELWSSVCPVKYFTGWRNPFPTGIRLFKPPPGLAVTSTARLGCARL